MKALLFCIMNYLLRFPLLIAMGGLLLASFLFILPGSALPKAGWMAALQIDKWVHVGIFSLLCFFWGIALGARRGYRAVLLFTTAMAYAFLVEVVQDRYVVNRGFDLWDVAADAVGIALGIWLTQYIKNKPL